MHNTLIVSHAADWDGMFSAAIVNQLWVNSDIILRNYDDEEPIEEMENHALIYITDMSLSIDTMRRFKDKIIYIDHHAAKIHKIDEEIGLKNFAGFRIDDTGSKSAAELAWSYLYPEKKLIWPVKLISVYDVFAKSDECWDDAYAFQFGMRLYELSVETASKFLDFSADTYTWMRNIIDNGKSFIRLKTKEAIDQFQMYGFSMNVSQNGNDYTVGVILTSEMSSTFSNPILEKGLAEVVFMINRQDANCYRMSVRVSDNSDFDACKYCNQFGGGGHLRASGCTLDFGQFVDIMRSAFSKGLNP